MQIPIDIELLAQLAPAEPMIYDSGECVWCHSPDGANCASSDPSTHAKDCPWIKARELISRASDIEDGFASR